MTITVGQPAPSFVMTTDSGAQVRLEDLKGRNVVLYFYPKDDTSGCTKQACAFRDAQPDFQGIEAEIIGVSKDGVASHKKFKDKYELNFVLAVDDSDVCERYGVWMEKSMYGKKYMGIERSTFLIDKEGCIKKIWRKVKVDGHAEEVLQAVREIGG